VVLIPEEMVGCQVVFETDNMACYYGWDNKYVKGDMTASFIIRALCVPSAYLNCNIHVNQLPRLSTWETGVVDRLSRNTTTTSNYLRLVESFGNLKAPFQSLLTAGTAKRGLVLAHEVAKRCKECNKNALNKLLNIINV
jgi:hypothetical protein